MYTSSIRNKRITIAKRSANTTGEFGKSSAGQKYEIIGDFWAAEDFNKGVKAMREGAVDAYDTVMFRMAYYPDIDRWCIIKYADMWYQIQSFNSSYRDNIIQITATEMPNQKINIINQSNI